MGCFGSKTDASAVVAVKPPSPLDKQPPAPWNSEDQWNVTSSVVHQQLNNTALGNMSHSQRESNGGGSGDTHNQMKRHQKRKSAADEQQGHWNEGQQGASTAGLAAANVHDESSPMVKMQSNYASNNSSTMKVGPSVQEHLPGEGDDFEEYMQQMKRNEEQREQLKLKRIGKLPAVNATPPQIVPVQQIKFAHENQDRVREHAAQILKNSEAVKQMSKNTFQLPPLNANLQKKMRKDNEQQLTDDFYMMLQNKKNLGQPNQQEHEGYDSLEPISKQALEAKKKSRKDDLENLLCELKDGESGSNISVAGSRRHQFSDRNLMDEEQPMIPLTNRSNNMISSLPAIQPQKKVAPQIKEIDFEGSNDPFMSPYVDQFMNVHKNNGVVSPKDNILVNAGGKAAPPSMRQIAQKPNRYGQYQEDDEEEESELDF